MQTNRKDNVSYSINKSLNSTLVQCKRPEVRLYIHEDIGLNSTLVQCKPFQIEPLDLGDVVFKFHSGSMQTPDKNTS